MSKRSPYTSTQCMEVEHYASIGMRDTEIAKYVNLHPSTIGKITSRYWNREMKLKQFKNN